MGRLILATAAIALSLAMWAAAPARADDCHTIRVGGFNSPQVCAPIPGGLK